MASDPNHTPITETTTRPRQFTIRGLLFLTFIVAILLSCYRILPDGSIPLLLSVVIGAYLLLVLWGGVVCLVNLFRDILRRF
jgi:uncharacterized BrkB/YihY/UPF0761 family membrane protein